MRTKLLSLILISLVLFSCRSRQNIAYFEGLDESNYPQEIAEVTMKYETKIAPDDILAITVTGLDPNAVAMFNLPAISYLNPGQQELTITPSLQTYNVDVDGDINFPILGPIKVAGLTRREATELLRNKISEYAKDPLVNIQIMNFKIAVLGEVTNPGTIQLKNERISILDALGEAGDLTIYGERRNVLLIRDYNGKKEFHRFDLTQPDLFASPYYYLKQNDVVYVEPNRARKGNARYSQNAQFNVSIISTVISAVSVIASLTIALFVNR